MYARYLLQQRFNEPGKNGQTWPGTKRQEELILRTWSEPDFDTPQHTQKLAKKTDENYNHYSVTGYNESLEAVWYKSKEIILQITNLKTVL
jgi:aspartate/methionine/tyrosine aminotransferase